MSMEHRSIKLAAARLRDTTYTEAAVQAKLAPASEEFIERYLRWCLAECETECDRGFRFVQTVRDLTVPVFLEYIQPLDRSDRLDLMRALCKKLHRPDELNRSEKRICERYDEFFTVPFRHPSGVLLPSTRAPLAQLERREEYSRRRPDRNKLQRDLRRALKSAADPVFGSIEVDHPSLLSYQRQVGGWYLVTSFEVGRREQLRYRHVLHALPGGASATRLSSGISLLNWTGIFPDTSWSWLLPGEIPETVKSVRNLCVYFIERAGELVAELPNPLLL